MQDYSYPWHEAPKWANYAATDCHGRRMWFENEPYWKNGAWMPSKGSYCNIGDTSEQSLRLRPDHNFPTSPDWSTAPNWAKWFAIYPNGRGSYFAEKPDLTGHGWKNPNVDGAYCVDAGYGFLTFGWDKSLQKRSENA